jgi:hypothetical protein
VHPPWSAYIDPHQQAAIISRPAQPVRTGTAATAHRSTALSKRSSSTEGRFVVRPTAASIDVAAIFLGFPFGRNHEGWGAPRLAPLLLALPAHRIARRVLRLEPRLRRPAAIRRICSLRDDALQPHAADVIENGRPVARQMLVVPDCSLPKRGCHSQHPRSAQTSPSIAQKDPKCCQCLLTPLGALRRRRLVPDLRGHGVSYTPAPIKAASSKRPVHGRLAIRPVDGRFWLVPA